MTALPTPPLVAGPRLHPLRTAAARRPGRSRRCPGPAPPAAPLYRSPSPAARRTCAPPSGCATRCSPVRWAPGWTGPSRAWTATPSTRTATTCWSGRPPPARSSAPTGCCRPSAPGSPAGSTPRASSTSPASRPIRDDLVEVGRSCVHPAHRDGAVIALIWAGLARYMERTGHNWLAGCCSIPLADGGTLAAATWDTVRTTHLAPEEYWVTPHRLWRRRRASPGAPDAAPSCPAAAARLSAARRLGLRRARVRPRLRRRGPVRPALAAPHRPALPAALPLPRPA